MGEIIGQLIELVNIGVAAMALFAGACVAMLGVAICVHTVGVRRVERREIRRSPRILRAAASASKQAAS